MRGKWGLGGSAAAVLMAVALSACGTGDAAPAKTPPNITTTTTTTTTVEPTTTTTVAPTTTTTTKKPTTTKRTTTTRPTTTHTTTTTRKPKPQKLAGVPCSSYVSACVDLSARHAWLISDGKVIRGPVSITSGRAGYRTPPGTFHVGWKDIDHVSKEFDNAPMPYSVFFNGGIAFHGGSLAAESHGCIHLSNASAQAFYNNLSVGDVVQVVP